MRFTAQIAFRPEHFNSRCGAIIPGRWTADLIDGVPETVTRIYSDGCASRSEAIADLISQMRKFGLSGNLKLIDA